jgi:hypothetical protein
VLHMGISYGLGVMELHGWVLLLFHSAVFVFLNGCGGGKGSYAFPFPFISNDFGDEIPNV